MEHWRVKLHIQATVWPISNHVIFVYSTLGSGWEGCLPYRVLDFFYFCAKRCPVLDGKIFVPIWQLGFSSWRLESATSCYRKVTTVMNSNLVMLGKLTWSELEIVGRRNKANAHASVLFSGRILTWVANCFSCICIHVTMWANMDVTRVNWQTKSLWKWQQWSKLIQQLINFISFIYARVVGFFHLFPNFSSLPLHYFDPGCVA